jgi:hypothetical protein
MIHINTRGRTTMQLTEIYRSTIAAVKGAAITALGAPRGLGGRNAGDGAHEHRGGALLRIGPGTSGEKDGELRAKYDANVAAYIDDGSDDVRFLLRLSRGWRGLREIKFSRADGSAGRICFRRWEEVEHGAIHQEPVGGMFWWRDPDGIMGKTGNRTHARAILEKRVLRRAERRHGGGLPSAM